MRKLLVLPALLFSILVGLATYSGLAHTQPWSPSGCQWGTTGVGGGNHGGVGPGE